MQQLSCGVLLLLHFLPAVSGISPFLLWDGNGGLQNTRSWRTASPSLQLGSLPHHLDQWSWRFYNREFVAEIGKGMGWNLPDGLTIILYVILMSSFGMVRSVGSALGEEIGWRGLLTPQLAKMNSYTATFSLDGCNLVDLPLPSPAFFQL